MSPASTDRARQVQRGITLEYFTIAYNSMEGLIGLVAGLLAGSVALVGFGLDSAIEVTSGAALLWRLRSDANVSRRARLEVLSLRIVGVCFMALAAYIGFQALSSIVLRDAPERSVPGIVLAIASLIVMPLLMRAKQRVAARIESAALAADAKQTEFCTYLSAILLCGLLLNAIFGWWWADPVAALVMVPIIGKEGYDALRGRTCCASCD